MLELKNISFNTQQKDDKQDILDNVSFVFERGHNYIITGANGSGKSTLAKIIMGLLPHDGQVFFDKQDITALDVTARAKMGFAYCLQQPVKFKGLTARDLLQYSAGKALTPSQACEYLSRVGLCARDYLDRELDATLSGGELKRIEIASVLARNAVVNIYDEPEAGIDIWGFDKLTEIFADCKDKINIIISHQQRLFNLADKILLLQDGKFTQCGKPSEILSKITKCGKLEGK